MLNKILMPSGGQTTDEMMILNWNKQVGDPVKRGDILFEIETDKAILTVESFAEGTLLEIKFPAGGMVKVGEVVALIGDKEDTALNKDKSGEEDHHVGAMTGKADVFYNNEVQAGAPRAVSSVPETFIAASPLARKMAAAEHVSLKDIFETTGNKVIKKADVEVFISEKRRKNLLDITSSVSHPVEQPDDFTLVNVLPVRKTIARRMVESLTLAPHYVISVDIDMTAAIRLRETFNRNIKQSGYRISYNDILSKVVSSAIREFPIINSTYLGDRVKLFKNVNIGLAVATDSGIIVPVVKEVNKKSISEIAQQNAANIAKVRSGKLQEADRQGGTITISNLGMFGINQFTAIINQPESCILAVGAIQRKPVADGESENIIVKPVMTITASFDHRIIDGAIGAPFLQKVKQLLEEPSLLL